jgi:hypothetical protein
MAVEVSCPACGAKLKAPEEKAGKKARCGKCGGKVRIPGPAPLADSVGESQLLSAIGTAPPLPDEDEPVPMAGAVEELAPPSPPANPFDFGRPAASAKPVATSPSPSNPGRPAFGSAAKHPAAPPPAATDPSRAAKESGSKPKAPSIAPPPPPAKSAAKKPPPPPPAQEVLSLDDEPAPAPPVGKPAPTQEPEAPVAGPAASDNPFAFGTGPAQTPKHGSKAKQKALDDDDEPPRTKGRGQQTDDEDEPEEQEGRRYHRPGGQKSNKMLLYAGVLGLAALGTAVAAVIVFVNKSKPPEPTKPSEKKEEPPAQPPTQPPTDPPKVDPKVDPKIDPKVGPKIDPKVDPKVDPKIDPKVDPKPLSDPGPAPGLPRLQLAGKLRTFKVSPPADKPADSDRGRGAMVLEVPVAGVKQVFPPAQVGVSDTYVLVQLNPGSGGVGERLALDAIGPAGRRFARIEYDGDGQEPKLCDLHRSKDGHRFVAAVGGKLTLWDVEKQAKLFDDIDPYAEKPEHKKAGLAAVFCTPDPNRVVTVSTAGAALLYDFRAGKPVSEFVPANGAPGRVALGRSVAVDPGGEVFAVAVGGVLYQVKTDATLTLLRDHKLGGDVGRSLGLAVETTPGKMMYVFETVSAPKATRKDRAVMFLTGADAKPIYFRWPDAAVGEPTGALWMDESAAVVTAQGVVWFYVLKLDRSVSAMAYVQPKGGKAGYSSFEHFFWSVVPHPTNPAQSVALAISMPPDDWAVYVDRFAEGQALPTLRLDDKGLLK